MIKRLAWFALIVLLALSPTPSFADDLQDRQSFMATAVQRLQHALPPKYQLQVTGPTEVNILRDGKVEFQVSFSRVYDFCLRDHDDCDNALTDFVGKMTSSIGFEPPKSKEALRAAVRSTRDIQGYQALAKDHPGFDPLSKQFVGDLWEVCMIDTPNLAAPLMHSKLDTYQVTDANVFDVCESNVTRALPAFSSIVLWIPKGEVKILSGDFYTSSLIFQHEAWGGVSSGFDAKLLITVPEPNTLIYARGDDEETIAALRDATAKVLAKSQRPLSDEILKWTPTGWEQAIPEGKTER